ncbi:hypothetical protein DOTSEDRAFT_175849 [Dothistroma septosporum NZE10]|uniref:NAD(P)-binding protein n=1 Tax=Dothistroma septosporum (strain NZE10 / CBS 128990) TaxID=675120 RepID=N1PKK4_DOTSN|nr:hypothetical protein DOTSEDRAFT_175849 [Dothistroma septosporum NZE10]
MHFTILSVSSTNDKTLHVEHHTEIRIRDPSQIASTRTRIAISKGTRHLQHGFVGRHAISKRCLPRRSITAVFVGATSGIGLGAIEALLKNSKASKLYIVGRSGSKFEETLIRLQRLDTSANLTFIEAQVSSLREVARVVGIMKQQETSIDRLWLSQGGLDSSAHSINDEGLFPDYAIRYYSRMLFMHQLKPLLEESDDARVISVLSAGFEGPINTSDFGMQNVENYSFWKAQKQSVSMMSLAMCIRSLAHPTISFTHTFPGVVRTPVHEKWAQTFTGVYAPVGWLVGWVFTPVFGLFSMTAEHAGQIGFYEMTDEKFSKGSGKNFFRLWDDAEETKKQEELLKMYRDDGTASRVWGHTLEAFEKALKA